MLLSKQVDICRITKRVAEATAEADEGCGYDCRITKKEAEAPLGDMCIVNGVSLGMGPNPPSVKDIALRDVSLFDDLYSPLSVHSHDLDT